MSQVARSAPLLAAFALGIGALAAIGCSALVSLDGLSTGSAADATTPPGEGGSPIDGGTTIDAADKDASTTDATPDADTHAGPNLLADSSFEGGCTWRSFQGTVATESNTARTGGKSCRVCTMPGTTDYFTGGDPFTPPKPVIGTTYHGTAWVRTAPGAATPAGAVLFLRTSNPTPFASIETATTNTAGLPFTDTWQRLDVTLTVTKSADQMDLFVGTDTVPGSCFLIDDVWLEKLP